MRYLISFGLLFCMSCNLSDPEVDSAPFEQVEVPEYEEMGEKFENVSFFLWKDAVPATHTISEVMKLATRYEALYAKTAPIRKKKAALEADPEYLTTLSEQAFAKTSLNKSVTAVELARLELARVEALLLTKFQELDAEHQKELPNREKIKELREQAKKLQEEVSLNLASVKSAEAQKFQLAQSLKLIETKLATHLREIESLRASSAPLEGELDSLRKALAQKSEWPATPPSELQITKSEFGLAPGLEIKGWDIDGGGKPRDLTSMGENPTICDVSYVKRGGILTFTVCVFEDDAQKKLEAAYRFRVTRKKTDAENVFIYSGDVWRNRPVDLVGGDDVEHPGDGQQDEDLPGEGDERRPPPDQGDEESDEQVDLPEYDCVDLSLMRVPGKTRSGVAKISNLGASESSF